MAPREQVAYAIGVKLYNIAEGKSVETLACPTRGAVRCARGAGSRPRSAMREAVGNLMAGITVSARARDEFLDRWETAAGRRLARGR